MSTVDAMAAIPRLGFLGTGAPFVADLNLVVQGAMGLALLAGGVLARRKRYRAHASCQVTVLVLNLAMIALIMWPSFHLQVMPRVPARLGRRYYAVGATHAALGGAAELLGIYVALVAGTNLAPPRLRFRRKRLWMRATLAFWWLVLLAGADTYYTWYMAT